MLRYFVVTLLLFCPHSLKTLDLFSLPQADVQGIVLSSKLLTLTGPKFPFNASLIENKDRTGYWLFFREDLEGETHERPSGARLGVVSLNKKFDQVGQALYPPYPIYGKSVEDPRAFWLQDHLYIMYYIYPRPAPVCPCLLEVDPVTLWPKHAQGHVFSCSQHPEKNWVPLVTEKQEENLNFLRTLYPQQLAQFNFRTNKVILSSKNETPMQAPPHWKWGPLSGGTPAYSTSAGYLSFFHSWFLNKNNKRTYVMGAALFDRKKPHQLQAMSSYPILFRHLYSGRACNMIGEIFSRKWAKKIDKVIFPCNFVQEKRTDGKEVIHLSCGENDIACN